MDISKYIYIFKLLCVGNIIKNKNINDLIQKPVSKTDELDIINNIILN